MDLLLVRHGEAEDDAASDEERALTGNGRRRMRKSARLLAEQIAGIDLVYTSPLVRAVQTAEILVGELGFDDPVRIAGELAGPTSFDRLVRYVAQSPAGTRAVALVGHEPILGALVGHCLSRPPVGFARGEIFALTLDRATSRFTFRWRIDPDGPNRTDTLER